MGIEPTTYRLQGGCSTTELTRRGDGPIRVVKNRPQVNMSDRRLVPSTVDRSAAREEVLRVQSSLVWSTSQLRLTTAFLAISAGLVSYTGLEFMLEAIQQDFTMSPDETIVLAQVSSGAGLLVVFLTGVLADRFGDRRLLNIACALFGAGAFVVGVAPNPAMLLIGQSVGGIGSIAMSIIGLSILSKTFTDTEHRARAFGTFAIVAPVVAIAMPFLSTAIIDQLSWRWVTLLWIALSFGAILLARLTFCHWISKSHVEPNCSHPRWLAWHCLALPCPFHSCALMPTRVITGTKLS